MKNFLISILILFTNLSCNNKEEVNTLSEEEKEAGWQLLFDGKTTNGWRIFKGGEVTGWKVQDGILYNSGVGSDHGGDIVTNDRFKDFELYLEWKIDSGSNSGVFYRVQELDDISAMYESGPEYQLRDDASNINRVKANQLSGASYAMYDPVGSDIKPVGEWNETRITLKGSHVEHWLNGKKVVEYELGSDEWEKRKNSSKWKKRPYYGIGKKGHIGLQDHGGLTGFRNIKIRKL